MALTVPFQPGMNLGRTFDLQKMRIGLDIFTEEAVAKSQTTDTSQTSIQYAVIKDSKDVNNILDVSGEISLKCKAGIVKAEGIGSYLKDNRAKENTLEILARAHVETVTISMTDSNPRSGWSENVTGTHYVRSITYGGDLIVKIQIESSDAKYFKKIKADVECGLHGGVIDAGAKANFRKMEDDLKSSSNISISYYSTTLHGMMPRDIDGMLKALDGFKDQVLALNEGKGVALKCELQPLFVLDSKLANVLRDRSLDAQLTTLEENYDDIREAREKLKQLMKRDDVEFSEEKELVAVKIDERIENLLTTFNKVIGNLDVTSEGNGPDQMEPAFKEYKKTKKLGGFIREVSMFAKSVLPVAGIQHTMVKDLPSGKRLDLILLGKTGHGKSATGNTIFGERNPFSSKMSSSSVTSKCQKEFADVGSRNICLVDTPGTMDTDDSDGTMKEITTAIASMPDGYHAFLIVLSVDVRMTKEEQMAIKMLKKLFGEDILMEYAILVFTRGDSFYGGDRKNSFKDFIQSQSGALAKLISETKERYVLFNNREPDEGKKREQVIELIRTVDKLQTDLGGRRYTNDLFDRAKQMLDEEKQKKEDREEKLKQKAEQDLKDKISAAREEGKQEGIEEMERKVGNELGEECKSKGRGCFLGDAEVQLENGQTLRMKELQVGDKVLSSVTDGNLTFSEVFFFGHRDEHGISSYIKVSTTSSQLKMTPDHHVYLIADGQPYTVPSEHIRKGDHIFIFDSKKMILKKEVVTDLSTSTEEGVYSPLTMSGTIIVNNMFVSCYGDYVLPSLSHILLWPMRQLYRFCPTLAASINRPEKNGMPRWVRWCMENVILPYRK